MSRPRFGLGPALLLACACQPRLQTLAEAGRYDEVIARAESARRPPRGPAAQAYAQALAARGQGERARAALLDDHRHGGRVESLVALADLEHQLGLDGVALAHYEHAVALDRTALRGRADVCDLFARRARALLALGEPVAAAHDMAQVRALCGQRRDPEQRAADARLDAAIQAGAREAVARRTSQTHCAAKDCGESGGSEAAELAAALSASRSAGPVALRKFSRKTGASLPADDVVSVLAAELEGRAGIDILTDDELQTMLGDLEFAAIEPALASAGPAIDAFVRLRLAACLPDVDLPPAASLRARQIERWSDTAAAAAGPHGYRVYAWRNDLPAAELVLATGFAPPPPAGSPPVSGHFSARVPLDSGSLPLALLGARLRRASGQEDHALELGRAVLARGVASGVHGARDAAVSEAVRALAWGRPWHALAFLEGVAGGEVAAVQAAAASGIVLKRAACGGACHDDSDEQTVARVMGDAWVAARLERVEDLAFSQREDVTRRAWACPGLEEVLAGDATGPLAAALLAERRQPGAAATGDHLRIAIESDITLVCAAAYAIPILAARGHVLSAAKVADMLAYDPQMVASAQLQVHASLAMIGGQRMRAELLARAAAARSGDPQRTWVSLAHTAGTNGMRSLERVALREALLHSVGLADARIRRELLASGLADSATSWGEQRTPAGREALRRFADDALASEPEALRWSLRDALARRLAAMPGMTADEIATVLAVSHHRDAVPGGPPAVVRSVFDADGLAAEIAGDPGASIPEAVEAFADPSGFERARLAVARGARDWATRRTAAVGVAVYGSRAARAEAAAILMAMAAALPRAERMVTDFLVGRPAALDAATGSATTAMLDDDALLRAVVGLDLAPLGASR